MTRIASLFVALNVCCNLSSAQPAKPGDVLTKIMFGSCADQNKPCPIWDKIADQKPQVSILLGDNIYADIENGRLKPSTPDKIKMCYDELAKVPAWQKLKANTTILPTWDDHDYGNNDAGANWEHRDAAQKIFLDFFEFPKDSPLYNQKGIYYSRIFGPEGKRVQIIMLDVRYHRSDIKKEKEVIPGTRIRPYIPNVDADATMLGKEQWDWLKQQLMMPAEVRLIGSGIQFVNDDHPFEKWGNFPNEREKFFQLIKDTNAHGVIFLSGDRHLGEISVENKIVGYPLYDITSSGLNQASLEWREVEKNKYRVAAMQWGNNFGNVMIDWERAVPLISLQLRDDKGDVVVQTKIPLSELKPNTNIPVVERPEGVLAPAEALKKKEGDEVTVQFPVAGGRLVGKRILLNSEKDFRSERNFTVVINEKAMTGKLEKATFDTFKDKTIRVKGKLSTFQGKLQIQVDDEKAVEIVEEKKDK